MELRTEIEIARSAAEVWKALTDFSGYGKWNPVLFEIDGALGEGEKLRLSFSQPMGRVTTIRPTITLVSPEKELRWRSRFLWRGLFEAEQFFLLTELPSGSTRLTHGENFHGVMSKRYAPTLPATARSFAKMNEALKDRVEGREPRHRVRPR